MIDLRSSRFFAPPAAPPVIFQEVEIDLPASSKVFLETGVYDWATEKARTLEVPLHAVRIVTASTFSTKLKKN